MDLYEYPKSGVEVCVFLAAQAREASEYFVVLHKESLSKSHQE